MGPVKLENRKKKHADKKQRVYGTFKKKLKNKKPSKEIRKVPFSPRSGLDPHFIFMFLVQTSLDSLIPITMKRLYALPQTIYCK